MEIETLPNWEIIGIVRTIRRPGFDLKETDFLLRGVRIRNTTDSTVNIERCVLNLTSAGKNEKTIIYSGDIIKKRAEELTKILPHWTSPETNENSRISNSDSEIKASLRAMAAGSFMGTREFWKSESFVNEEVLETGQETGFMLEHFEVHATEVIDDLKVSIVYAQDSQKRSASVNIPIIQYQNKNLYSFPLRGSWYVTGGWVNPHYHRMMSSQEFAYDFIKLDSELRAPSKEKRPNEDIPCYGEDILAIADGKVVDCFGAMPENECTHTLPNKERLFDLAREYGSYATLFGNYVILKHSGEEYSFYGHLMPNSLRIKSGDRVSKAQLIGSVGNSGNSEGPHLHFQLMDGPNFFESRGLPCHFTNTIDTYGERMGLINRNHTIIHVEEGRGEIDNGG